MNKVLILGSMFCILLNSFAIAGAKEPYPLNGNVGNGDSIVTDASLVTSPLLLEDGSEAQVVSNGTIQSPIIEEFDDPNIFTSTNPERVYISNGLVHWNVSRSAGKQFVYREIPRFSGDVKLTVRGQVNSWTNNCFVHAGIGDRLKEPPENEHQVQLAVKIGYIGGGCGPDRPNTPPGAVVMGSGVDLDMYEPSRCNYSGNWLRINPGVPYTAELTVAGEDATLTVPEVGTSTGTRIYNGEFSLLFVGLSDAFDSPSCSGTIDSIIIEPLGNQAPILTVDKPTITPDEGTIAKNSGTVTASSGSPVTLSPSIGKVDLLENGVWEWSYTTTDGPDETQTVTINAVDNLGNSGQVSFDMIVNNVAPTVQADLDGTVLLGTTYYGLGSFTDPGNDEWTATYNFGDNTSDRAKEPLGKEYYLSHQYIDPGTYSLEVEVADDDGGTGNLDGVVHVLAPQEVIERLIDQLNEPSWARRLNHGQRKLLTKKLSSAKRYLENGNKRAAISVLEAFIDTVTDLVRSKRYREPLINQTRLIISSLLRQELRYYAKSRYFPKWKTRMLIGTSVVDWQDEPFFSNDVDYHETLGTQFNSLTPESTFKMGHLLCSPTISDPCPAMFTNPEEVRNIDFKEKINFSKADQVVEIAIENGMYVRGHTLVWGDHLPEWLTNVDWTGNEIYLKEFLEKYIQVVVSHFEEKYPGRVIAWDVVNEAIDATGESPFYSYRDNFWYQKLGADYIPLSFKAAREAAGSNVALFYNDYDWEGLGDKSAAVARFVRDLVNSDMPIDGVGMQMHVSLDNYPSSSSLEKYINKLGRFGLQVQITEMDVRIAKSTQYPTLSQKFEAQAKVYGEVLRACLNTNACTGFTMWGLTDRYSWIYNNKAFDGEPWPDFPVEQPLIFDYYYNPKPAYFALLYELGH